MSLKPIKYYNSAVLRRPTKEIMRVDDSIKQLAEDMLETMLHANGVGLAAPQIGVSKQLIIVYAGKEYQDIPYVLLNPVVIKEEGEQTDSEGCLSLPELYLPIKRASYVKIQAMDIGENLIELEAEDLLARALLHETDHLHGKLFIDYCSDAEVLDMELCKMKDRISCLLNV